MTFDVPIFQAVCIIDVARAYCANIALAHQCSSYPILGWSGKELDRRVGVSMPIAKMSSRFVSGRIWKMSLWVFWSDWEHELCVFLVKLRK